VCFPVPDAGCCDSRSNPTTAALFAFGFGVLLLRRRRR
jgi:MYXO-CTERM domain-containing protein